MRKNILIATALLANSFIYAQSDTTSLLNEVVVTANKFQQKQNTTGKVVTVIGQDILSKSIGKNLSELLNQQTGITIVGAQNTIGTNQDLYMRGAATGRTLVLIDGVPAYDPSTISTAFDLNHISLQNIERIEIVRGAMSTLYGSDAVAGVINIITKKGKGKPVSAYATAAAGSFATHKLMAGLNGHFKNNWYNVQYNHIHSRGFTAAFDSVGNKDFDKDGYQQNVVNAHFTKQLHDRWQWKLKGQAGKYKADLDNAAFTDEKDYTLESKNYQAGTSLEYKYKTGSLVFNYNYNTTDRIFLDDSLFVGGFAKYTRQHYVGRAHAAEIYSNISLNKFVDLLIGSQYSFQNTDQQFLSISSYGKYETSRAKDSTSMSQYSLYASAFLKTAGNFHVELGGRYNNHSQYHNHFTYTFNPSYLIRDKIKLFANIASAFKSPSLYQLYVTNQADRHPGNALKPETSTSMDAGIELNNNNKTIFARALYFNRKTKNGFDYNLVSYQYFNYNLQKDHGAEAEVKATLDKLSLAFNYTYIDGQVNTLKYKYDAANYSYVSTGDTTYFNLFRRPKHTMNITMGYSPLEHLTISAHARFAGKRLEPVFLSSPIEMDAYQTLDLYTHYQVNKQLKIFADIQNITNTRFFDILGYNSMRRNFMAGVYFEW